MNLIEKRDEILRLEEFIKKIPGAVEGDSDQCPLKHSFTDGFYVREIFIPKGFLVVGKLHKHSHPNFLMSGEVTVYTEHKGTERIKGPCSMISEPGTKRVVYAHEDTVWVTVHLNPSNTKDLEKIESEVIAKTYKELPELKEDLCLGYPQQ